MSKLKNYILGAISKTLSLLAIALGGTLLTGCGEWLEFDEEKPGLPTSIDLLTREVRMIVGDTLKLRASIEPEEYADMPYGFSSGDEDIVSINVDTVFAKNVGICEVAVWAKSGGLRDTCLVTVLDRWGEPDTGTRHDMVVYANPKFNGKPLDPDMEIAAFHKGELCGRGERKSVNGVDYMEIRVWRNLLSREGYEVPITFCLHRVSPSMLIDSKEYILFDGETHGTLSELVSLNFDLE